MRIAAVTMAIPPRVQSAHELAPLIHRSPDWIAQQTGVLRRYVADDDVSPAQLAACAAREALLFTGPPDLILYAGALTQQLVPDTSAFVQRELELERIPCFTVNQTCLSFIAALQVAHGLLKVGSYKRVLICTGELATRGRSFEEPESAALLGDGAAAAVVEYSDETSSDLIHCDIETWNGRRCFIRSRVVAMVDPRVLEAVQELLRNRKMRILITGGTGFVGSRVASALAESGQEVTVTGRNRYRVGGAWHPNVQFVASDIRDANSVDSICRDQNVVIHAAAFAAAWGDAKEFQAVNVQGTENVVHACIGQQGVRVVHVSSTAIHFEFRDKQMVSEDATLPKRFACEYAKSKAAAEEVIRHAVSNGLNAVILRARAVYGPGDNPNCDLSFR